jgi:hypothetical protein
MSQYPSLFESIKKILVESNLNIHLMLFDPLDGCYHWFIGQEPKNVDEVVIQDEQDKNSPLNGIEIKKLFTNPNEFKDKINSDLFNLIEKLIESIKNWEELNITEELKQSSNYYERLLSALPSESSWDVNGLYHKIFFGVKKSNENEKSKEENFFSGIEEYLDQFKREPIFFIDYFDHNYVEKLKCECILEGKIKTIFDLSYEDKIDRAEQPYETIYNALRKNLFPEMRVEKFVTLPIVISGYFWGIAFKEIKEEEFKNEERNFLENIMRYIQPAVTRLIQNEFDKRFLRDIDKFRTFEDIITSFCLNINLIARCDLLECTISHPNKKENITYYFGWEKGKKFWTEKFTKIKQPKKINEVKNNRNTTTITTITIKHKIENSWEIQITIYTTANLEEVNKIEIEQLIKQKIIALVEPTFERLKRLRNLYCLQVRARTLAHRYNKILAPYAIPSKTVEEKIKNECGYFPAFFEYLRGLFNNNAYTALPGYNFMTAKQIASDVMKSFWPRTAEDQNYQEIIVRELLKDRKNQFDIFIEKNNREITEENDLSIWFPNDMIGVHCFYNILENIIANIKKHMSNTENLKIKIEDYNDKLYKVKISHIDQNNKLVKIPDKNFKKVQSYISEPVVSTIGRPRESGWGILEMKTSACYLRGISFEDIDEPNDPPIIEAYNNDIDGFHYIIYLLKPKIASIYNYQGELNLPDWLEKAETPTETKTKFFVEISTENENEKEIRNGQLYLKLNQNEFEALIRENDPNKFEYNLWLKWLGENFINEYEIINQKGNDIKRYVLFNNQEGRTQIVFDNHGYHESDYVNFFYYEPYSTGLGTDNYLQRLERNSEKNLAICEIVFSATREILIIDERIDELTKKEKEKFRKMKIYIEGKIPENFSGNYHYILIHLTLIEKIAGSEKENIKNWIDDQKKKFNKDTQFIVISDRGSPPNLPEDELFLPFDPIFYIMFYLHSKIHLCNLLLMARKIK